MANLQFHIQHPGCLSLRLEALCLQGMLACDKLSKLKEVPVVHGRCLIIDKRISAVLYPCNQCVAAAMFHKGGAAM